MTQTDAETAYLFRHALLRDAAYEMQLPGDRAVQHRHALTVLEALVPDLQPIAEDLATHARLGCHADYPDNEELLARELGYLRVAARYCAGRYQYHRAAQLWTAIVEHRALGRSALCEALRSQCDALWYSGCVEPAIAALNRALDEAECQGDRRELAVIRAKRCRQLRMRGMVEDSMAELEAALPLLQEHEMHVQEAILMVDLAHALATRRARDPGAGRRRALGRYCQREPGNPAGPDRPQGRSPQAAR
jgi:hypothetical protein